MDTAAQGPEPDALVAALCDIEAALGLFDLRIDGVRFWHLIRMPVYCRLAMAHGLMTSNRLRGYKAVPGSMRAVTPARLAPLLRGRARHLVVPAQTRFAGNAGRVEPLSARVLDELEPGAARVLELVPVDPGDCDHRGHDDVVQAGGLVRAIARLAAAIARSRRYRRADRRDAASRAVLQGPARRAFEALGIQANDLWSVALSAACSYRAARWSYGLLLARWRPLWLYLTVAYGKEALIDAARARGTRVVEFQHGLIRRHHVGYHFPHGVHGDGRPDLLALYGEYWSRDACFAPGLRAQVVGSPRAAGAARSAGQAESRRGILVLSGQPFEGASVADYARTLARSHPDRSVVVRTHPNQRTAYERLLEGEVRIELDPGDRPIEAALSRAGHVVTGCSTALFEGLAHGCRTLLVDSPHSRWICEAVGAGGLRVVRSPEDAARSLESAPRPPDMSRFLAAPVTPLLPRLEAALER